MDEGDAQARADAALVERAVREGDPRIYAILVRRHQGPVRAQLRRLLGTPQHGRDLSMADDLAQECFVLAWRKLHQFRGDARFATWLHRIAHTCFLQHQRKRSTSMPATPAESAEGEPADPAADAIAPTPDLRLDLDAALQRLSPPQRTALLYCAQLGLSHEEAAEVLEMPLGTLKTHVARGKARLRELLHDWADAREECP